MGLLLVQHCSLHSYGHSLCSTKFVCMTLYLGCEPLYGGGNSDFPFRSTAPGPVLVCYLFFNTLSCVQKIDAIFAMPCRALIIDHCADPVQLSHAVSATSQGHRHRASAIIYYLHKPQCHHECHVCSFCSLQCVNGFGSHGVRAQSRVPSSPSASRDLNVRWLID
jgi:hypothetical protein